MFIENSLIECPESVLSPDLGMGGSSNKFKLVSSLILVWVSRLVLYKIYFHFDTNEWERKIEIFYIFFLSIQFWSIHKWIDFMKQFQQVLMIMIQVRRCLLRSDELWFNFLVLVLRFFLFHPDHIFCKLWHKLSDDLLSLCCWFWIFQLFPLDAIK